MIHCKPGYRVAAMAVVLAAFSGCQQLSMLREGHLPWSTTARLRQTPTQPPAETCEPLRPEQKAEIQIAMARSLERQGRTDEAKKMYLEAVNAAPQRADAYHLLALLYDRNGECQTAVEHYQQALELDGENADLHCDVGYNCYLRQQWQEAETHLRRALELSPSLGRAHNNLGLVLARTGREGQALEEFLRAGSGPAEAHANLAYVLTLADRWNEAQQAFQQALAINPNLKSAQEGLARLQALAARRETAVAGNPATPPPAIAADIRR